MRRSHKRGQLRIIGGEWRGRKLEFPDVSDLRPTTDRIRETLFNWLQMQIPGARCLDLFAGSGALGLEALSRGAADVVFVEQDKTAVQQIRQHLTTLKCLSANVVNGDVIRYLQTAATAFDIVFLDPPYRLDSLTECCQLLEQNGWLKDEAVIYLEHASKGPPPQLPDNWQISRSKKAGDVSYNLAVRSGKR